MEYRILGRTGLCVSLARLGSGGASRLGQAAGLAAGASHRIVRRALDLGINLFDTSPAYGESEELLGGALQGVSRDAYVLATKFPPPADDPDPEALMRVLERSLRRLRVDAVDLLQYHGVAASQYRRVVDRYHAVALRAQQAGKVRFLGITEPGAVDTTHEMLHMALEDDLFDTIMVKYGILNQSAAKRTLPEARRRNVGVLVMAAVRTSLRTPAEAVARLKEIRGEGVVNVAHATLADPLGIEEATGSPIRLTAAAYQFAAQDRAVSSVLIGTGNMEHLEQNVNDLLSGTLTEDQARYLRRAYGRLTWHS